MEVSLEWECGKDCRTHRIKFCGWRVLAECLVVSSGHQVKLAGSEVVTVVHLNKELAIGTHIDLGTSQGLLDAIGLIVEKMSGLLIG